MADDPETLRIRNTSKIISNVSYHGDYEKKKQMEERRNQLETDNNNIAPFAKPTDKMAAKKVPHYAPSNNNKVPQQQAVKTVNTAPIGNYFICWRLFILIKRQLFIF